MENGKFAPNGCTILLINQPVVLNERKMSKSVYVCRSKEQIVLKGKLLSVTFSDSQKFDIHGHFKPSVNNDDLLDEIYKTKHVLFFGNRITVSDKKKIAKLKQRRAFSEYMKSELVEFTANAWVPPHCHGKAFNKKAFIDKYEKEFGFNSIKEKYAHPQLIFILKGDGFIYTDLDITHVKKDDIIIYGSNTIHMSKSGNKGMSYIHFVWNKQ
ncbi:MAG: hypothetical protein WC489_06595 [Patescibacteria group bacterium]